MVKYLSLLVLRFRGGSRALTGHMQQTYFLQNPIMHWNWFLILDVPRGKKGEAGFPGASLSFSPGLSGGVCGVYVD